MALSQSAHVPRERRGEAYRTWQNVEEALVGVAAGKFQQVLADVVAAFASTYPVAKPAR
jgi:hypothetical protein